MHKKMWVRVCVCAHVCVHACVQRTPKCWCQTKATRPPPLSHLSLCLSLSLHLSLYGTKLPPECPDPSHEREAAACMCVFLCVFVRVRGGLDNAKNWQTTNAVGTDGQANRHTKKRNNTSSYRPPIGHTHAHKMWAGRHGPMHDNQQMQIHTHTGSYTHTHSQQISAAHIDMLWQMN